MCIVTAHFIYIYTYYDPSIYLQIISDADDQIVHSIEKIFKDLSTRCKLNLPVQECDHLNYSFIKKVNYHTNKKNRKFYQAWLLSKTNRN